MASVAGGTFKMGYRVLNAAYWDRVAVGQGPGGKHGEVTVRPFLLDVTEVTASAYKECVDAGACTAPGPGTARTYDVVGRGEHPVNYVDWSQAAAYCRWANKRLPTDEEWEWAARGGPRGTAYPWGDEAPGGQLCWDGEGSDLGKGKRPTTCPVGSYPNGDTADGVHDLAGSVWEWTTGNYDSPEPGVTARTPAGDDPGIGTRVVRGGGWHDTYLAGAGHREGYGSSNRQNDLGFRCASSS